MTVLNPTLSALVCIEHHGIAKYLETDDNTPTQVFVWFCSNHLHMALQVISTQVEGKTRAYISAGDLNFSLNQHIFYSRICWFLNVYRV